MGKARYVMIGGFLGAGKTTAVLKLAEHLTARGSRVGLITNDQSVGLVDTAMLQSKGFDVEEIAGGCFCCRFNSLVDAADRLSADARPDVFIAEPVGSCTDLKASVSYPLRRLYGNDFSIAPLSVLIDPVRAARILGIEPGRAFSPKVVYVYLKQLEEAEIIVINKIDAVDTARRAALRQALVQRFPNAAISEISARQGDGLMGWFDQIAGADLGDATPMHLDYEMYAEGEALLGWLNCSVAVACEAEGDGNLLLHRLASHTQNDLGKDGIEIAHLKMTLAPREGSDLAVLNLTRSDGRVEMSFELDAPIVGGDLIINLRAEAPPDRLELAVRGALGRCLMDGWTGDISHLESFKPAKPEPTHRDAVG